MRASDRILVVTPTYNERENIVLLIEALLSLPLNLSLLVVDDASPDGTQTLVKKAQKKYQNLYLIAQKEKKGIGPAYVSGFRFALKNDYAYVLQMDADFSHNPKDVAALVSACADEGCDISIGSRYVKGVNVVNWSLGRMLLSYTACKFVEQILGMGIRDATAGFVCYAKHALKNLNLNKIRASGYAFQIEMKYRAWKQKFKIKEVSVVFVDRTRGKSKMSMRIFSEALWTVIRLRFSALFSKTKP